ncbi:membrane lipoprotein lipid attachment site-containing protein [Metabacillus sp. KIGAM252]|uniref:Membrane lipoprotein lipid attachment site-containing protein n=1 Tax=Metabacillus flavus TaxID=2823519 RepID=A0ABS5LDG0_9BACI|nr:membrane lipoprotein lipid attachment site-containing protein [Metabacillus flavus]MBS2968737.1 membrane lipoprotein lipid attachment site-containing protein [Metabacillus flavus]
MRRAVFLAFILFFLAGCQNTQSKEVIKKAPKAPESTMAVKDLSTGNEELVRYTASEHSFNSNVNNIDFSIESLYNSNNKKYIYIMKLSNKDPIEIQGKNRPNRYKILRISAGVNEDRSKGQFMISASSPLYRNGSDYKLEGTYQLFSAKQKFAGEQFLVEAILTNDERIGDSEPGVQTFRAYFENEKTILYD